MSLPRTWAIRKGFSVSVKLAACSTRKIKHSYKAIQMDFPHWLLQPKVNYKPDIIKESQCSTFQFISLYSKDLNAEVQAFSHIFIFARQTHTLEQTLFIYVYFNYHFCYLLWQSMPSGHSWGDELSGMHIKTKQQNQVQLNLAELLKNLGTQQLGKATAGHF